MKLNARKTADLSRCTVPRDVRYFEGLSREPLIKVIMELFL
jgi:hypothetical protein